MIYFISLLDIEKKTLKRNIFSIYEIAEIVRDKIN